MGNDDGPETTDRIERARRWMLQQEPARRWSRHDAEQFLEEFDRRGDPRRAVAAKAVLAEMAAAWMAVTEPGYDYDDDDGDYPHYEFEDMYARLWRADVLIPDEELYDEAAKYLNARPRLF
jgi:hypothetical protein